MIKNRFVDKQVHQVPLISLSKQRFYDTTEASKRKEKKGGEILKFTGHLVKNTIYASSHYSP